MNISKPHETVGIVWYTKEEWGKMKDICTDKERFEDTYEAWEAMVNRTIADMKKEGLICKKIFVDSEEFLSWCKSSSNPLDASSRSRFIVEKEMGAER